MTEYWKLEFKMVMNLSYQIMIMNMIDRSSQFVQWFNFYAESQTFISHLIRQPSWILRWPTCFSEKVGSWSLLMPNLKLVWQNKRFFLNIDLNLQHWWLLLRRCCICSGYITIFPQAWMGSLKLSYSLQSLSCIRLVKKHWQQTFHITELLFNS